MKRLFLLCAIIGLNHSLKAQFAIQNNLPQWHVNDEVMLVTPEEGLWSVATDWENDWPSKWLHIQPQEQMQSGAWTVLTGKKEMNNGELRLRDAYRELENGRTQGIRRRSEERSGGKEG